MFCLFLLVFSAVPIVRLTIYDSLPFSADVPSPVQPPVAFAGEKRCVYTACESSDRKWSWISMPHLSVRALVAMYIVNHTAGKNDAAKQRQRCSRG